MAGDYAVGLLTIITGLAIADVVTSLHALLMNRTKVKWDWLTLLATCFIVILIIAIWSISYQNANSRDFNPPFWEFTLRLLQIFPMYLAARAILPDEVGNEGVSLSEHYDRVSRYFWASVALTYSFYLGSSIMSQGLDGLGGANLSPVAQFAMMIVMIFVRRRSVHAVLLPATFTLLCADHLTTPMFG